MTAFERVTRSVFPRGLDPISDPRAMSALPVRIWSDQDWERIGLGYRARDMDEKWHVFAEGDVVYLHRSWTGYGVFEATFAAVEGGGRRIVGAVVESDAERYRCTDDEHNVVMLELVLSAIVLGEPAGELRTRLVEWARRQGGPEVPGAALQHSLLGLRS